MIRHISMFHMDPSPANGCTVEENMASLRAFLEDFQALDPRIVGCRVGVSVDTPQEIPAGASVLLTQVILMLDFARSEDAAAFPASEAHQELMAFSKGMVSQVAAIDFEI